MIFGVDTDNEHFKKYTATAMLCFERMVLSLVKLQRMYGCGASVMSVKWPTSTCTGPEQGSDFVISNS